MTENIAIGQCSLCGCGNRPGPWHRDDCLAYMPTDEFRKEVCPVCSTQNITEESITEYFPNRKGKSYRIDDYKFTKCNNTDCGIEFVTATQARHNEQKKEIAE